MSRTLSQIGGQDSSPREFHQWRRPGGEGGDPRILETFEKSETGLGENAGQPEAK